MSQLFLCSEETFYEIVNRTSDGKEEIKDEVSEENKEEKDLHEEKRELKV